MKVPYPPMLFPAGVHHLVGKGICFSGSDEVDGAASESAAHHARSQCIEVAGYIDQGVQFRAAYLEVIPQ